MKGEQNLQAMLLLIICMDPADASCMIHPSDDQRCQCRFAGVEVWLDMRPDTWPLTIGEGAETRCR